MCLSSLCVCGARKPQGKELRVLTHSCCQIFQKKTANKNKPIKTEINQTALYGKQYLNIATRICLLVFGHCNINFVKNSGYQTRETQEHCYGYHGINHRNFEFCSIPTWNAL